MRELLAVSDARELVLNQARRLPGVHTNQLVSGLVLDEDVASDIDLPPFDKALVDGYAVHESDCTNEPSRILRVLESVYAGDVPTQELQPGCCALVMTGAALPKGTSTVALIERSRACATNQVEIAGPIHAGQNWLSQGAELQKGECIFERGTRLTPAHIGVLASIGKIGGWHVPSPNAAVISTGDELVEPDHAPGPGQIRNSNRPTLLELLPSFGAWPSFEAHVQDDADRLCGLFQERLKGPDAKEQQILVITGGVSAGQRDLVPDALVKAGVTPIFHKVALRPGKPIWFGVGPHTGYGPPCLVFGLPGNPVSVLVCSLLFIKPAIEVMSGRAPTPLVPRTATLTQTFQHSGERMSFLPAKRVATDPLSIELARWNGSSDLRTIANSDGFAIFDAGDRAYQPGDRVGFLPIDQ